VSDYIWVGMWHKVGFFFYLELAYLSANYYIGFQLSEVQMLGYRTLPRTLYPYCIS